MKKLYYTLLPILIFLNAACGSNESTQNDSLTDTGSTSVEPNEFMEKYSGGYTIEVDNYPSDRSAEVYILKDDGYAKWMWINNDGSGGANVEDEKEGTWTARENAISVAIQGNTGLITEDFELKDGVFHEVTQGHRYLKLSQ